MRVVKAFSTFSVAVTISAFWAEAASAICYPGQVCNAVPEIDGPAGIAAMGLLAGIAAILYNKARK